MDFSIFWKEMDFLFPSSCIRLKSSLKLSVSIPGGNGLSLASCFTFASKKGDGVFCDLVPGKMFFLPVFGKVLPVLLILPVLPDTCIIYGIRLQIYGCIYPCILLQIYRHIYSCIDPCIDILWFSLDLFLKIRHDSLLLRRFALQIVRFGMNFSSFRSGLGAGSLPIMKLPFIICQSHKL